MTAKAMMITGAAALLLVAGGCSKKVGGQVVAIANDQEITQQELNAELNGAKVPQTADKKVVMAQLLQRVIDRKLLVAKAKKDGLDQSPSYLAQVQRAQDTILLDLLASKIGKGLPVPDAAAADKFMAQNATLFSARKRYQLDQIAFPVTPDPILEQKMKAAKTMDAVETALKEAGIQYQKGQGALDSGSLPPAIATQIAALPAGEPFLVPQAGQVIASVIRSTESVPVPVQQAKPVAAELIRRQAVQAAMANEVKTARASAKIEYQDGFAPAKGTATAPAR